MFHKICSVFFCVVILMCLESAVDGIPGVTEAANDWSWLGKGRVKNWVFRTVSYQNIKHNFFFFEKSFHIFTENTNLFSFICFNVGLIFCFIDDWREICYCVKFMFLKFRKAKNLQEDMHSLTNKLKSMQVKVEKVSCLGRLLFAHLWRHISLHLNASLNRGETERLSIPVYRYFLCY